MDLGKVGLQLRPTVCLHDQTLQDMWNGAVQPHAGAETGAGGRMRDTHATGIGSLMGAGLAGYCVGNLRLEGASAPWEDPSFEYPGSLASPLQVLPGWRAPCHAHDALPWLTSCAEELLAREQLRLAAQVRVHL